MSAISLTNAERIEALKRLGYTEREAAFLCLAALHGGYFLRRQYWDFIGQESGSAAASLLEKLQTRKHVVATTALNQTRIYHLASRPFFNAIGESDNRNRREHSPLSIKTRLMGIDFVLAHQNYRYLATEREKVDYFSGILGVSVKDLPFKHYLSVKSSSTTVRHFVDKYPIFLNDTISNDPRCRASFCFVDEGAATLSGFETYLDQYAGLWRHLHNVEVIYVADATLLFAAAERRFEAFLSHLNGSVNGVEARLAMRLIKHFEARSLFEKGDIGSFSREKLIQFRNDREEFSEQKHQALYERWKANGRQAVLDQIAPRVEVPPRREAFFSTCFLEHCYDLFEGA